MTIRRLSPGTGPLVTHRESVAHRLMMISLSMTVITVVQARA